MNATSAGCNKGENGGGGCPTRACKRRRTKGKAVEVRRNEEEERQRRRRRKESFRDPREAVGLSSWFPRSHNRRSRCMGTGSPVIQSFVPLPAELTSRYLPSAVALFPFLQCCEGATERKVLHANEKETRPTLSTYPAVFQVSRTSRRINGELFRVQISGEANEVLVKFDDLRDCLPLPAEWKVGVNRVSLCFFCDTIATETGLQTRYTREFCLFTSRSRSTAAVLAPATYRREIVLP